MALFHLKEPAITLFLLVYVIIEFSNHILQCTKDSGSLTVSGQRVVKYSIKIVSLLRPLDYVFASPTENVKSSPVPTCLDDSFQKRDTLKRGLKRSRKRRAQNETRFFVFVETRSKTNSEGLHY